MPFFGSGILNGLRITLRNMRRGPITLQYPHERNELPERSRWAVQLKLNEDGSHRCTSCQACVRACPDSVLFIDDTTAEDRSKHINLFNYELGACMMCGICVTACPFDAIEMSQNYELSTLDPATMTYPFLEDSPAASAKRKSAAKTEAGAPARPRPERTRGAAAEGAEPVAEAGEARPVRPRPARVRDGAAEPPVGGSDNPDPESVNPAPEAVNPAAEAVVAKATDAAVEAPAQPTTEVSDEGQPDA